MQGIPSRRRSIRVNVDWPATVLAGRDRTPCTIVDISFGGARLELNAELDERAYVVVLCTRFGSLDGQVVWRKRPYAGTKLSDPGTLAALAPHLRAAVPPGAPVVAKVVFGRRKV